jgi:alkanesulfonate monooxygenase SsuD/methylene tetrahydromethanopterin reductase-like flavin-dependent oxidoreductase (luciferase family)
MVGEARVPAPWTSGSDCRTPCRASDRAGIVEWARRAEQAGFSSLGTIDRIVYDNYESLIALAAAAAVTERIRLMTDILIAPLRSSTALLAKQAATLNHLSGGRAVMGLAVGGRQDDYEASGVDFGLARAHLRSPARGDGAPLERRHRGGSGEPADGADRRRFGHRDPACLPATATAGRWAAPRPTRSPRRWASSARPGRPRGRAGTPRTAALFYYALGDDPEAQARAALGDYYAFLGDYTEMVIAGAAKDEGAIRDRLAAFEQAGCDEVVCFPTSPDPAQVDLLASAVLTQPTSSAGTG